MALSAAARARVVSLRLMIGLLVAYTGCVHHLILPRVT